jgi:hypothetical protein
MVWIEIQAEQNASYNVNQHCLGCAKDHQVFGTGLNHFFTIWLIGSGRFIKIFGFVDNFGAAKWLLMIFIRITGLMGSCGVFL